MPGYGYCPECKTPNAEGSTRERRPNGFTTCGACGEKTHSQRWKDKLPSKPKKPKHIVVVKKPGEEPEVVRWDKITSEAHKEMIDGGWLEAIRIPDETFDIWMDEEGKLKGLPINFGLPWDDVIVGPAFFAMIDEEGETIGLTPENILRIGRFLHEHKR
jgi:hypothetical protein